MTTMATLSRPHKAIQISTEIVFDPDVDDPRDDLSVFRDVDVFFQHVEDVIAVRGPETVRDNLHFCLRGAANLWWSSSRKSIKWLCAMTKLPGFVNELADFKTVSVNALAILSLMGCVEITLQIPSSNCFSCRMWCASEFEDGKFKLEH